jgi:hypothetical protein
MGEVAVHLRGDGFHGSKGPGGTLREDAASVSKALFSSVEESLLSESLLSESSKEERPRPRVCMSTFPTESLIRAMEG